MKSKLKELLTTHRRVVVVILSAAAVAAGIAVEPAILDAIVLVASVLV